MKIKLIVTLLIVMGISTSIYSQSKKDGSYVGFYGALVPSKVDYGGLDASYNKLGYALGFEKNRAIGSFGLGWITSLTAIIQPYDKNKIKEEIEANGNVDLDTMDFKMKPVFNFPIMTGLRFQKNIIDKLEVYGQAQIGLNIHKMGNWNDDEGESDYEVKPLLGYTVAGGIIINKRFNLGVRYYILGEPETKVTFYPIDGPSQTSKLDKIKINLLAFVFGINF